MEKKEEKIKVYELDFGDTNLLDENIDTITDWIKSDMHDLKDDDEEIREKGFYPLFMANPEIIQTSDDSEEEIEGCLSVPEQRITVIRPKRVKVKYLDYNNKKQEIDASGWFGRAIQHEIDHLDGKLMINYLSKLKKDIILRKLIKLKRNAA